VRVPGGGVAILYQYQPAVTGDTDDTGTLLGGAGLNASPDDFTCELYDYQRLMYGRTAITLWDPTMQDKASNVVRTYQDTRVHLPDWTALGGTATTAGSWRVGQLGDAYIAYLPLGTIESETPQNGWTYLVLKGRSGGVVEIASAAEFATIDEYAKDLASRYVSFTDTPLAAEIDARDPETTGHVRVRLEYRPQRRVVGGVEQSVPQALAHGLIDSPWAQWDATTERLTLSRRCYAPVVYDWKAETVTGP
jgi:hypothetical protein